VGERTLKTSRTLLDIDLRSLLRRLEEASGTKFPKEVVEASLVRNVLHVRFSYLRGTEVEVEPLDLKTPVFLFRDCETGDVTAVEVLDVDELLKELGL
jgi:predicted RNA-binding protein associated with RNAse of E/G family